MDNFNNAFPGTTWFHSGTASNPNNTAELQITGFGSAAAWIQLFGVVGDECAATIDLDDQPNPGGVFLNIKGFTTLDIDYFESSHTVSAGGVDALLQNKPKSIGIALTGGQIYYVYRAQGSWHVLGPPVARPGWMAFSAPVIGFGVTSQTTQPSASFDNFNTSSISPQDIGL